MSTAAPRIYRAPDVCSRTGLSRSQIYRLVQLGQFPGPVQLSARVSGWVASEVDGWISSRIAASQRTAQCRPQTEPA